MNISEFQLITKCFKIMNENKVKWTYDTVKAEASKYKTRREFQKSCGSAYNVARKNGWLDDYDWFVDGNKRRAENDRKWNYETAKEEAKKYKTRAEFSKGCGSAYNVARKNGWLDEWFGHQHKSWDYESVKAEAMKYKTRAEFYKGCNKAYAAARKNGWLDEWFGHQRKSWDYNTCKEEARKYKSESEFRKGNSSAHHVARKNGWLDEYDWFEQKKSKTKWLLEL